MPRSQGRIIVSPTAPMELLQAMIPLGSSQALSRKLASPRGENGDGDARSLSPSESPRQRPRRLPGGLVTDAPEVPTRREAWGLDAQIPRAVHEQRGSASVSRPPSGRKAKKGGSLPHTPLPPQMTVEWQNHSLFGGERCTNPKAKRSGATTFRRPTSSRAPPHQRPIFVVGPDAQDPRICVDINAPQRFSSFERTRYERSWCQAKVASHPDEGSRAPATIRNIGHSGAPSSGRASALGSRNSFVDGRSGTPGMRPESVGRVFRGGFGPSPTPGQRTPLPTRPASSAQAQRSWSAPTPPPAPACWSGA